MKIKKYKLKIQILLATHLYKELTKQKYNWKNTEKKYKIQLYKLKLKIQIKNTNPISKTHLYKELTKQKYN